MTRPAQTALYTVAVLVLFAYAGGSVGASQVPEKYAPPKESALPPSDMTLDLERTGLLITDPRSTFSARRV